MQENGEKKIIDASLAIIKKRKLISMISFVLSIFFIIGATIAWQSTNKQTDSSGFNTNVTVTSNLVISKSSDDIKNANFLGTSSPLSVSFSNDVKKMTPCSLDWEKGNLTGLYYPSDLGEVSPVTGVNNGFGYVAVPVGDPSSNYIYYYDYVVYLASAGKAQTSNLNVTLSSAAVLNDTFKAASIAFYVGDTVSSGTHKATLNLANAGRVLLQNNLSIPKNTDGSVKITMRCYFDGALEKDANNTYIRSGSIDVSKLTFNVAFDTYD